MIDNKTVIISCAGMGKRLGLGTTKALIEVCDESLIIRTLKLLNDVSDVRVVVGFQADDVIKKVRSFRKDVIFVMNNNYMNTGTAGSVSLALDGTKDYVLTIDGDLIIHPDDMKKILEYNGEFICGCDISSEDPVKMSLNDGNVTEFSREKGDVEWTGICCLKKQNIKKSDKHVYQMIEPNLPVKYLHIRTKEIDTMDDYYRATKWVKNNFKENMVVGVLGGMGSYATLNIFKKYLEKFQAEKEWERPRIIIDNNCTMPSRVRAILFNEDREILNNEINRSIKSLIQAGATDVFLACNTSHFFLDGIIDDFSNYNCKIHNIIKECIDYLEQIGNKNVYLIASEGTIQAGIFDKKSEKINFVYSKEDFVTIRKFIESVKQNKITKQIIDEFVVFLNNASEDIVVLGCTELPVLYDLCKERINKKVIDPIDVVLDNLHTKFLKD